MKHLIKTIRPSNSTNLYGNQTFGVEPFYATYIRFRSKKAKRIIKIKNILNISHISRN